MKNVVALSALLIACGIGTLKAQSSAPLKTVNNKQLAVNFITDISFTPEVNNSIVGGSSAINTTLPVTTHPEIAVDPSTSENLIEKVSSIQFKYAMMLNIEVETLAAYTTLFNFIEEWYGTHYRMGGTTKKGIDCSAFSGTLLATVFSLNVPRTAREQYKVCEHLNKEDLLAGDLVFFNTRGGVSHVGVYLANNYFVHSSSSEGVRISSLNEDYYSRKFICGGRVNQ